MAVLERALADTRRAFDQVAADYGRSNAANRVLVAMRERVLGAVGDRVSPGARLLDLGCGPGCDVETLARAGFHVTAIDWSPAMVSEARQRIASAGLDRAADVVHLGIHELDRLAPSAFDAAYSNFGPLNCVPSLEQSARLIADRLRPGGVLVASVIGRWCPWEIALFASRGDWRRLRVRFGRAAAAVPLDGHVVWTRYYSPGEFLRPFAAAGFDVDDVRGLGVFVPPPYMQAFAERHAALVDRLQRLDDLLAGLPGLRALGDHFLVALEKRRSP